MKRGMVSLFVALSKVLPDGCGIMRHAAFIALFAVFYGVGFPTVVSAQIRARSGAEEYFNRGNEQLKAGDLKSAAENYRKAAEVAPDNFQVHFNYAIVLRDLGRIDEAKAEFLRAIDLNPEHVFAHFHLGLMCVQNRDFPLAVEHLNFVVEKEPGEEVFFYLGSAYQGMSKTEEAMDCYLKTIAINPRNFGAWYNIGLIRFYDGDSAGALEAYRSALEIVPDQSMVYVNMGLAYMSDARTGEAERHFERAVELDPNNFYALFNYGDALIFNGRAEQAVGYLKKAFELNPSRLTPGNRLGEAYEQLGRREDAINQYLSVLEKSPSNSRASFNLYNLLNKLNLPPQLAVSATFSDASGDNRLGAEEDGFVVVSVKNTGKGEAHIIGIGLAPEGAFDGITVGSPQTIRRLKPGQTEKVEIHMHGQKDIQAGEARFSLNIQELHDFNPEIPTEIIVRTIGM